MKEKHVIQKILIKVSKEQNDLAFLIPLVHHIGELISCYSLRSRQFHEDESNVERVFDDLVEVILILNQNHFDISKILFNALPFKVSAHFISDKEWTFLGIHRFAYNLYEVFNVDLYIDLESTLKSAFLGLCFRSKIKVGFANGLNRLFLNYKFNEKERAVNREFRYLNLVKLYFIEKLNLDYSFDEQRAFQGFTEDEIKKQELDLQENQQETNQQETNQQHEDQSQEDKQEIEELSKLKKQCDYQIVLVSIHNEKFKNFWQNFYDSFLGVHFVTTVEILDLQKSQKLEETLILAGSGVVNIKSNFKEKPNLALIVDNVVQDSALNSCDLKQSKDFGKNLISIIHKNDIYAYFKHKKIVSILITDNPFIANIGAYLGISSILVQDKFDNFYPMQSLRNTPFILKLNETTPYRIFLKDKGVDLKNGFDDLVKFFLNHFNS